MRYRTVIQVRRTLLIEAASEKDAIGKARRLYDEVLNETHHADMKEVIEFDVVEVELMDGEKDLEAMDVTGE